MIPKASIIVRGQWKQTKNSAKYLGVALLSLEYARNSSSNHDRRRLVKKQNRCKRSLIDQVKSEYRHMLSKSEFLHEQYLELRRTDR